GGLIAGSDAAVKQVLALEEPLSMIEARDSIYERLNEDLHEGRWRDAWLDLIAWRCGFQRNVLGSGKAFLDHLGGTDKHLVALVDGLEDIFQNVATSESQQTALRSLLQEVPSWLQQQPHQRLGLVVFIRSD